MMELNYPDGATPLDSDEIEGLIPTNVTTRAELDRWEQDNINEALAWLEDHKPGDILNEAFMKRLHKRMFCNVWKWSGKFRHSDKNIGVPWHRVGIDLEILCGDVQYWIDHQTFSGDEIATRFHHRLVSIRLFSNGNGRHARLMADALLEYVFNEPPFTWGSADLIESGEDRKKYIECLMAADRGEYDLQLECVRS